VALMEPIQSLYLSLLDDRCDLLQQRQLLTRAYTNRADDTAASAARIEQHLMRIEMALDRCAQSMRAL
jgi:hypothetical protein